MERGLSNYRFITVAAVREYEHSFFRSAQFHE
jgi:hypothetical protein